MLNISFTIKKIKVKISARPRSTILNDQSMQMKDNINRISAILRAKFDILPTPTTKQQIEASTKNKNQ